ncbi:hypothetical protein AVEN_84785-1 [Araneus ventricosus]|uniref:Uncharacterized protein n=1 Tax=Araneus ventricosus TaxID=182803 RepID=A0A4Y2MW91_ARAVE|nr:hypothetical protein AVEN_84785-1 [Araneus ventricosus]
MQILPPCVPNVRLSTVTVDKDPTVPSPSSCTSHRMVQSGHEKSIRSGQFAQRAGYSIKSRTSSGYGSIQTFATSEKNGPQAGKLRILTRDKIQIRC